MVMPTFTMRQLLEAGVHFGHRTRRWNPKMEPYIFGVRNKVHIIDLQQTVPLLYQGMQAVRAVAANGGRVLFVGTKRQASKNLSEAAKRCGQYYVDHRWLGGMLTNWKTISNSIRRLRDLEEQLGAEDVGLTKKELLRLTRERDKLDRALGGIKEMGAPPDVVVVIDTNKEAIAVREARKLEIPVIAVVDSNSDPDGITYPIPGNDDSLRAIELYCELLADAVLDGLEEEARKSGVDVGESETGMTENLPAEDEKADGDAAEESKPSTAKTADKDAKAADKDAKTADKAEDDSTGAKETKAPAAGDTTESSAADGETAVIDKSKPEDGATAGS
jgi:small subunit ribosomal protein S2